MAQIKDQTLSGRVDLDGGEFVNVVFDGAALFYEGGKAPNFQNCTFKEGCSFTFREQAWNTLAFIRSMAHPSANMRFIVDGLIPELTLKAGAA